MFGTLPQSPLQSAALRQVEAWTRERFSLPGEVAVLVTELPCAQPGCPPLETVIAFWTAPDRRHHYKVFKPVQQVRADDLPPYWMRDALVLPPDYECGCC